MKRGCAIVDPLIKLLKEHMRVAVENGGWIKCWCDRRFADGDEHRAHVAVLIRELLENERG